MTSTDRKPFDVRCGNCKHVWTALYMPMSLHTASEIIGALRCPMCAAASHNIFHVTEEA